MTVPRPRLRATAASLLAGAALACCGCGGASPPDPALGQAALDEALALIEAHPDRAAGPASRAAAAWIASRLPEGAKTETFPSPRGTLANVSYAPPGVTPAAVLVSHFDTKVGIPGFVGANDGASTTGLLIALARHTDLPVLYLFVDGEECVAEYGADDGLHGSWHAARTGFGGDLPVIVLDMLGDADWNPIVAGNGSARLNAVILRAADDLELPVREGHAVIDDHIPFVAAGRAAADIIDFDYGPANGYWHTAADTPERISADSLAKAAALIRRTLELLTKEIP